MALIEASNTFFLEAESPNWSVINLLLPSDINVLTYPWKVIYFYTALKHLKER